MRQLDLLPLLNEVSDLSLRVLDLGRPDTVEFANSCWGRARYWMNRLDSLTEECAGIIWDSFEVDKGVLEEIINQ